MGLDMYLTGTKSFWKDYGHPESHPKMDNFEISEIRLKLGYWRKHPNLHGFIVQQFAEGRDECQRIELGADDIKLIIEAIQSRALPHTEGFFFGASDDSDAQIREDCEIFMRALMWLEEGEQFPKPELVTNSRDILQAYKVPTDIPRETRSVIYRASW